MQSLTPKMKVIEVTFDPDRLSKLYSFFTHIEDLKPGDWVVVASNHDIPSVVQVVNTEGLSPAALQAATKCIVQKVDFDEYHERIKQLQAIREIQNELKARKEQLDEMIIYSQLAESDPTMKALVDKLNGLVPDAIPTLPKPKTKEN